MIGFILDALYQIILDNFQEISPFGIVSFRRFFHMYNFVIDVIVYLHGQFQSVYFHSVPNFHIPSIKKIFNT